MAGLIEPHDRTNERHLSLLRSAFCMLAALALIAQAGLALNPDRTLTQYTHRIWDQEEGLVQPTVYSILQTRDGYLWLGTQDSLIRFDGIHFHEFGGDGDPSLGRSIIRALDEDRRGNLWIGSIGNGLGRLADGHFTWYTTEQGLPSNIVTCVASDNKGALWVCTNKGLARWDGARFHVYTHADGLPSDRIRGTCEAADGTRWIAGADFGLSRWAGGRFVPFTQFALPARQGIHALACGSDGSIWAGTDDGLAWIKDGAVRTFTSKDGLADGSVLSLFAGADGSLWAGTRDGISRLYHGEISTYRTKDGLSHSLVLSLYVDREGSLWAGTKNGLDQFSESTVTPYTTSEGMPGNDAGPVTEDREGKLWVGTLGNGLAEFDGRRFKTLTTRDGLIDNRILSLHVDDSGDLWAGTAKGLSRLRNGRVIGLYTTHEGLAGNEIRSMFTDYGGTLLVGTNRGLSVFRDGRFAPFPGGAPLKGNIVALGGARAMRLFVSTEPGSLYYLDKNRFVEYGPREALRRPASAYYVDHENHALWMGTLGTGILRWRDGKLTAFRVKDGLYDDLIYSILPDNSSNFWIASSKGIFRVSREQLDAFAAGRITRFASIPFTTGQLRFECQSGVDPAAWKTKDGRLWFSTTNGLVVVDPNRLIRNSIAPPVQVEAAFVNGERRDLRGASELRPWEKNLEIHYAALSFIAPEKITFRYKLEGYDKSWVDAGTRRGAFYTNLPPGNFRFHVIASNSDGVWDRNGAAVGFSIAPFFYQRAWFFPALAIFIALAIWVGYQRRIRRLREQFDLVLAERNRIARELHDTLLQGLSGITMQLQALWTKLPLSPEKHTLHEIIKDSADCLTEARRSLWGLRSHDSECSGLATRLERAARQATKDHPVRLILKIQPEPFPASADIEYQLLRIAQEGIANCLRHAEANTIEVSLSFDDGAIRLAVRDDGHGFDFTPERVRDGHYGLVGMRERAQELGGELTVSSAPAFGTEISLVLPAPVSDPARVHANRTVEKELARG
jgi:ligand-binding sensor domain-containing protein/signal transduction histidine kinase